MKTKMNRIVVAGWLFVAVSLFSGCYNAAEERRKAIHELAQAMAQMGYEYGRLGVPKSDVTNRVNQIMEKMSH